MIPISDQNPTSRQVILVPILIAINVIVFFFVQPTLVSNRKVRAERQLEFFVCRAAIPYEVTHGSQLDDVDRGLLDPFGRGVAAFQERQCPHKSVWRSIVTSMFLHAGFFHLASNMLFLWIFGNNVEDRFGRLRFIVFYVLCGLAATFAQSYVGPSSTVPMIGASGAIAGVLGAYLLMFPHARIRTLVMFFFISVVDMPAIVLLGLWFVLQVFQGVGSATGGAGTGVAYMAHIGGFLAGMLLLFVFRPRRAPAY